MRPSAKQQEVIDFARSGKYKTFISEGAVRSGKSTASAAAHAAFVTQHPEHDHAIVGETSDTAMRNIIRGEIGTLSVLDAFEYSYKLSSDGGKHILVETDPPTRIYIIGGNNSKAVGRLAGATLGSALLDEALGIPEEVFRMLWSRLSPSYSKLWITTNPGPSRHFFKKQVLDDLGRYRGKSLQFFMDDNPGLSEDVKRDIESGLTGHYRDRYVKGLWVDAEGRIFPDLQIDNHPKLSKHRVALDWASSGTFAALLFAKSRDHWTIISERYHDGAALGVLTDEEHAQKTHRWIRSFTRGSVDVIGDPSTSAGFQKALERLGFTWWDADNEILPGIQKTISDINTGKIRMVSYGLSNFRDELSSYRWDEKAAERGEDKPLKTADHGMDALRYFAYTNIYDPIRTGAW